MNDYFPLEPDTADKSIQMWIQGYTDISGKTYLYYIVFYNNNDNVYFMTKETKLLRQDQMFIDQPH